MSVYTASHNKQAKNALVRFLRFPRFFAQEAKVSDQALDFFFDFFFVSLWKQFRAIVFSQIGLDQVGNWTVLRPSGPESSPAYLSLTWSISSQRCISTCGSYLSVGVSPAERMDGIFCFGVHLIESNMKKNADGQEVCAVEEVDEMKHINSCLVGMN